MTDLDIRERLAEHLSASLNDRGIENTVVQYTVGYTTKKFATITVYFSPDFIFIVAPNTHSKIDYERPDAIELTLSKAIEIWENSENREYSPVKLPQRYLRPPPWTSP